MNTIFYKLKKNRNEDGAVIAEAALVLPLLVGILFFIIEFGLVMYFSNSLNQVARTAARYASLTTSYTQSGVETASGASIVLPDSMNFSLTITPTPGSAKSIGDTITVTVQYTYVPVINPYGLFNSMLSWAPVIKSYAISRAEVSP